MCMCVYVCVQRGGGSCKIECLTDRLILKTCLSGPNRASLSLTEREDTGTLEGRRERTNRVAQYRGCDKHTDRSYERGHHGKNHAQRRHKKERNERCSRGFQFVSCSHSLIQSKWSDMGGAFEDSREVSPAPLSPLQPKEGSPLSDLAGDGATTESVPTKPKPVFKFGMGLVRIALCFLLCCCLFCCCVAVPPHACKLSRHHDLSDGIMLYRAAGR